MNRYPHPPTFSPESERVLEPPGSRPAASDDEIAGAPVRLVAEPHTTEEAADVITWTHRTGMTVAPRGAGTKLEWGNKPESIDLVVSTKAMNRMLEHASGDLVVRAEAGTSLEALQREVQKAGQRLALDPPHPGATLGGIIATNASGPLRFRYGTVRDLLIGIRFVLADGTAAKSGSKVVKNVAGYDLGKLFTGSLGTLGLITEAIFRLHPLPDSSRLVCCSWPQGTSHSRMGEPLAEVLRSTLVPSAVELDWDADRRLLLLFEGVEPGVNGQSARAVSMLREFGQVDVYEGDVLRSIWKGRKLIAQDPEDLELKIGAPIASLASVLQAIDTSVDSAGQCCRLASHAGTGVTHLVVRGDVDRLMVLVSDLRRRVTEIGGHAVVLRAPQRVKETVDVWGTVGDALPLMRRIKERFDPHRTFNPGRYVGGI